MEIKDEGLPIKEDAELKIRSRLFLEGNYFVDLHPGPPTGTSSTPAARSGPNQTAAPVQFGQVLTALQRDTREDLQTLLEEYSNALAGAARAASTRRSSTGRRRGATPRR